MIIARLRLDPFGCFTDREIGFAPGLNVVLGPNEAGKSTIFKAIRHALFLPAKLPKNLAEKYVAPFLPAGGGDTIQAEMEIEAPGGRWVLKRRWGAAAISQLTLPTGASLADEEAIRRELSLLLPARPGTVTGILMTGQAELSSTLESLEGDTDGALADLDDILRKAMRDTGGVSVDRFRTLLGRRIEETFSRWDRSRKGPQDGRGIENPWKKEIGTILAAHYEAEKVGAALKAAQAFESERDEVNAKLRAVAVETAGRESFVTRHRKTAEDTRERRNLDAELGKVHLELEGLGKANSEWPAAARGARDLREAIAALAQKSGQLEREMLEARREEENRGLREKHARVSRRMAQREEARGKLASAPPLERRALEEIRNASSELDTMRAGRDAAKLSVTIAARAEVELVVQEDFSPESRVNLGSGKTAGLRAGGRLRIAHRDMEIEVRSGDTGLELGAERVAKARRALQELLAANGVADVAEAEAFFLSYEAVAAEAEAAEKNLAEELGGDTVAALEARIAALGPAGQTRPLPDVASALARVQSDSEAKGRELSALLQSVQDWEEKYGTPEKLRAALLQATHREEELAVRLARSAPLPEGFLNGEEFLREYENAQGELVRLGREESRLLAQKEGLESRRPDQSAEELERRLKETREDFESACRRGEAFDRIGALAEELLGGSDSAVYSGMRAELERLISAMTEGRHVRVEMDGSVPRRFMSRDGTRLGWERLSGGTKDALALALRLAMASFFLGDAGGFLLMDDPLVDMDPQRQGAAGEALKSFAASRQLILFTCHPWTADLLGGNLIML